MLRVKQRHQISTCPTRTTFDRATKIRFFRTFLWARRRRIPPASDFFVRHWGVGRSAFSSRLRARDLSFVSATRLLFSSAFLHSLRRLRLLEAPFRNLRGGQARVQITAN